MDIGSQDLTLEKVYPKKRVRPEHKAKGDPCETCGVSAARHRTREGRHIDRPKVLDRIIGVDGEGMGRGPHLYNYLAAADEAGETWEVAAESLSSKDILEFLLELPKAVIVGFSLGYDITKWLADLPDAKIYKLLHPETRRKFRMGKVIYRSVKWEGYRLNYMNGRFTVGRLKDRKPDGRVTVVWDIFKFFQSRFTKALEDWYIVGKENLEEMIAMKELRGSFDTVDPERVKQYCKDECFQLAKLFRALIEAHEDAGLKLKTYFGAGSTSSALLKKMSIKDYIKAPPEEMKHAVACGFVGGRFENAIIGPVDGPIYSADISSAYPYHATFLPCLIHGTWSHCDSVNDSDVSGATLALVHWKLPHVEPVGYWAPFPVRGEDKRVVYPWSAPGGWVWAKEYLSGKQLCPHVEATEAWYYHTSCSCRPFGELPTYYLERVRVGKTSGRGKVFKLGPNGIYGKLAQTVGHLPPFQSFIMAGNITSNTRAQLLDLIVPEPAAIYSVATDGIQGSGLPELPIPADTRTNSTGLPLGGWEPDKEGGRFYMRPGVSESLDGSGHTKSRGYNKKLLRAQFDCVRQAWEHGHDWVCIDDGELFESARGAIHKSKSGYHRSEKYGEWFRSFKIMSFDPAPKRVRLPGTNRLGLLTHWQEESYPYAPAL